MAGHVLYLEDTPWAFGGARRPLERSRYVVYGVPLDATASFRGGQRWGPLEARKASAMIEFYSLRAGLDVDEVPIADVGDVAVPPGDAASAVSRAEEAALWLAGEGRVPVMLGGEHTATLGALRGIRRAGRNPCMLVFDAHFDLRAEYLGVRLSHATVMRRAVETLSPPLVAYVGVRAFSGEELAYARSNPKVKYYTTRDIQRMGEVNVASNLAGGLAAAGCDSLYVTVDLDVLDPAHAPGVGNPEPEGITPFTLYEILHSTIASAGLPLAGADVVELAPPHDCGGITAVAAAKTVVEIVAAEEARLRRPS